MQHARPTRTKATISITPNPPLAIKPLSRVQLTTRPLASTSLAYYLQTRGSSLGLQIAVPNIGLQSILLTHEAASQNTKRQFSSTMANSTYVMALESLFQTMKKSASSKSAPKMTTRICVALLTHQFYIWRTGLSVTSAGSLPQPTGRI